MLIWGVEFSREVSERGVVAGHCRSDGVPVHARVISGLSGFELGLFSTSHRRVCLLLGLHLPSVLQGSFPRTLREQAWSTSAQSRHEVALLHDVVRTEGAEESISVEVMNHESSEVWAVRVLATQSRHSDVWTRSWYLGDDQFLHVHEIPWCGLGL